MPDIRSMVQSISNTGLMKPNKFTVQVNFPEMLFPQGMNPIQGQNIISALATRSSRVTLPSYAVDVYEMVSDSRVSLPIVRSVSSFEPIAIAMILSEDGREREYFERWLNKIHGRENGYSPLFYDNYVAPSVVVNIPSESAGTKTQYYYTNAYPISVGDVEFAYEENDSYVVCTVTMNYERFFRVVSTKES